MPNSDGDILGSVRVRTIEEIRRLPQDTEVVHVIDLDDEKMTALTRFAELKDIISDGCDKLTDSGLHVIERFQKLQTLDIEGATRITDDGLEQVIFARHLKSLDIRGCSSISKDAVWRLSSAIPGCEVDADTDDDNESHGGHGF